MVMGKMGLFSLLSRKGATKEHSQKAGGDGKQQAAGQHGAPAVLPGESPAVLLPTLVGSKEQEGRQHAQEYTGDLAPLLNSVSSIAVTLRDASDHVRLGNVNGARTGEAVFVPPVVQEKQATRKNDGMDELGHKAGTAGPGLLNGSDGDEVELSPRQDMEGQHLHLGTEDRPHQGARVQRHQLSSSPDSEGQLQCMAGRDSLHEDGSQQSGDCSPYATSMGNFGMEYCCHPEHDVPEHLSDPGVYFDREEGPNGSEMHEEARQEGEAARGTRGQKSLSDCYQPSEANYEGSQLLRLSGSEGVSANDEAGLPHSEPGLSPRSEHCNFGHRTRSAPGDVDAQWTLEPGLDGDSCCFGEDRKVDVTQEEANGVAVGTEVSPSSDRTVDLARLQSEGHCGEGGPLVHLREGHVVETPVLSLSAPNLLELPATSPVESADATGFLSTLVGTARLKQNDVMKLALMLDEAERSSMARVHDWVKHASSAPGCPPEDEENDKRVEQEPRSPTAKGDSRRALSSGHLAGMGAPSAAAAEAAALGGGPSGAVMDIDVEYANRCVRSVDRLAATAHLSSRGLAVLPSLASFQNLKSLYLAHNGISRIPSGSLPRSLHLLDLSHNRLFAVEGLRELTRLRVLNLSYNRIARTGHGLASCSSLRELYLAGNKISEVEGLHRLLKLTVLDLAHNKVTSTKALGQLAANYASMQALNLAGNPIHVNLGDDAFRRFITGLLPQLVYLNQQPVKTVSARDVATDGVARAALGAHNLGRGTKAAARSSTRSAAGSRKAPPAGHHRSNSSGALQPSKNIPSAPSSNRGRARLAERPERHRRRQSGTTGREEGQPRPQAKRASGRPAPALPREAPADGAVPGEAGATTADAQPGRGERAVQAV